MYEKRIQTLYLREMALSMLVYMTLLILSIKYARGMDEGLLRTLFLASPVIGVCSIVWAIARHVGRVDEFVRKTTLETLAIAAGLTAGITFTYGFLETAGFPRLSMFAVLPLMGAIWGMLACARCLFNRE
jgi:hypothetical protein